MKKMGDGKLKYSFDTYCMMPKGMCYSRNGVSNGVYFYYVIEFGGDKGEGQSKSQIFLMEGLRKSGQRWHCKECDQGVKV